MYFLAEVVSIQKKLTLLINQQINIKTSFEDELKERQTTISKVNNLNLSKLRTISPLFFVSNTNNFKIYLYYIKHWNLNRFAYLIAAGNPKH